MIDTVPPPARHPIVGVSACTRQLNDYVADCVAHKYTEALVRAGGCLPLLIPALAEALDIDALLQAVDGIFLTGSPSNVAPGQYDAGPEGEQVLDVRRDATTLPLIREAIARGVPLLAACRGLQEMNVALGGTLSQQVHADPGRLDHRENTLVPETERYDLVHSVDLVEGGTLAGLLGASSIQVNSLHSQGIAQLAEGLIIEATAPDGLVEAIRVRDAPAFALAVQWHPEWQAWNNPHSMALYQAFAEACRARATQKAAA
ncbi:MAG: gamma-glutamyl-gamma-aminobutyrate hydrolase family protein [Pseudomonadota bacterium]